MKKSMLVSITLLTAIYVAGCGKSSEQHTVKGAGATVKGATVESVKSAATPDVIELSGTVRARTVAVVSTRIPGSIVVLKVKEGDRVKKGQLLAQLDARENQANAAVSAAGSDEARRALDEAVSRKRLADATFERYHNLFNEQAVSRQEFEIKQTEKELAMQGLARAEARLKQAQESANASAVMSDYTRIIAPLNGIVAGKQVDLGATVFPGQPLMTIEDDSGYQLELALPENLAAKVKTGTSIQVSLDANSISFAGRIAEIVPTSDPASRTFNVKVMLPQKGLKTGMFGRGVISLGTTVTAITIAKSALVEHGAISSVWIVDKDASARMRIVKVGRQIGGRVEILAGLSDGDRVITSGAANITEGAKVE